MVEVAFVVPILLILVVGVADFGRIFATGLTLEAAARDAAEFAANDYLANPPGATASVPVGLNQPAPTGDPSYYGPLHARTAEIVCQETRALPNTNYDGATNTCPGMPLVLVCVHDSQDTDCSTEVTGTAIPAQCGSLAAAPSNSQAPGSTERWVEIRLCYRWTPILAMPFLSFSEIWLDRVRSFGIPCYYALGTDACG